MPEYLAPGVYVEEISTGPRPIEGVSTSTAGFVGQTERGPTTPRLTTSWVEYVRWFGSYIDSRISYLPFAIKGFFDNGGQRAYVARVHRSDAAAARIDLDAGGGQALHLKANGPGEWGNRIFARVKPASRDPQRFFRLTLLYYAIVPPLPLVDPFDAKKVADANRRDPDLVEDYDDLSTDPLASNYVLGALSSASQLVEAKWSDDSAAPANPKQIAFADAVLTKGGDGTAVMTATEFLGDPEEPPNLQKGLAGLGAIDDISLLCVPDHVHGALDGASRNALMQAIVTQCELLKDRFAVLNVEGGLGEPKRISDDYPERDSSYAAVYTPWVRVFDPRSNDTLLVPPGGHVTGIIARTDVERGVHKAPANAEVRGIITRDLNGSKKPLQFIFGKGHQDVLNPRGINVIRDFRPDGRGIRLWGARTTSSDPEWKYVNVRRLFLYVEESIDEGTQWVVFEPNDEPLWAKVRRSITNFLIRVWRSGALQGATQEEAFFVKCDRTTMTQDDIDNGRLICFVGIAPVKPAEFVIFRISQKTADAEA